MKHPMTPNRLATIALLALWGGLPGGARGDQAPAPAPEDSLLAALVQEALAKNPAVKAADEALQGARFRPDQVRSLPNPMLSVQYTNDGVEPSLGQQDMTTLAFMWSQDVPFPGKRGLRRDILSREADQVQQQLDRVKLGVTASVKRAYYGLLLARDLLGVVREQEGIWKQIEGIARARYSVGQATQQDVLRVQIEVTRVEQRRAEQDLQILIRLAELNQLLDRPLESPLATTSRLVPRTVDRDLGAWLETARGVSPEMKSASLAVERDRLGVKLARKEFRPDLTFEAGYMNRGGLDPMWQAGVGLSLPLYRKRPSNGLSEAQARLRATERGVEAVQLLLRFRTQERVAQIKTTERIAGLYGQSIIPQDQLSVDAAISNYQVGKIPFVTVLEALATLYSDRSTYLGLLANHEMLRASLEEASLEAGPAMAGGLPTAIGAMGAAASDAQVSGVMK